MEPASWQLARRLIARGIAGILVPGFAPGATHRDENLVLWKWSERPPQQVRVCPATSDRGGNVDEALTNRPHPRVARGTGAMSIRGIAGWRPIGGGSFNLNNWLNSQAAVTQQDLSANDAANSAFTTAQSNYFQNLSSLTEQAALERVQAEVKAKQAALQQLISSVGGTVNKVA